MTAQQNQTLQTGEATVRIMMVGYGAMGREVHRLLPEGLSLDWVILPAQSNLTEHRQLRDIETFTEIDQCAERPDLVLECAGQAGVREHGEAILRRGLNLAVISVGALADQALRNRLEAAAQAGGGRLILLSGAIAGIDGLAAAREGGLDEVTYESCKAPKSWKGSHAEKLIDLDTVNEKTVFYEGKAEEAARLFPANANVAATVGLAGIGLEATTVKLSVDPHTTTNTHRIYARGRFGEFHIELNGRPLEHNPKTSTLAALSVVRACRQALAPIVI